MLKATLCLTDVSRWQSEGVTIVITDKSVTIVTAQSHKPAHCKQATVSTCQDSVGPIGYAGTIMYGEWWRDCPGMLGMTRELGASQWRYWEPLQKPCLWKHC